ncbi:inverse autotransporter beta domain-containing protein, partial [Morganella psychrotolerans]|uniref:inverse autotransporter beta domain-containing protein n=1 Tax=Morganella psychrotolerans TaxID=368603 RepID=UPI000AFB688D
MPVTSYYSKTKRVTAYLLLFLQLFFPISVATSSVAYAIEQDNAVMMSETFDGLNALIDTSPAPAGNSSAGNSGGNNFTVQMPAGSGFGVMPADPGAGFISGQNGMTFPMSVSTLPDPAKPAPRDNTVRTDDIFSALPTMGLPDLSPEDDAAASEAKWAGNASQAGQILSSDDAVNASVGYVRSLGENLLNQQVNDWLNQVGHARVQFGSNKTGDADLLIPLVDNPNSLLFSQFGIRANDERTTTNLGLGYRQYEEGWMWGLNSFYDYDITGSNSRVGVGGELWADYVKLAANGYFRITDWHQSTLNEMRDYDERPANGFDVRAEGYLPDYPQLGAFVKYEQYFGDGVSLARTTSTGKLKSNPSVSTVGLSYTPFPLITFKGETSAGDSNDSKVGMELSYRFGVPLSQQLDTENVDLMRNLAGNRYDFVDRNYNIVMQYRKQELLRIGLPPELKGEAAQTLPVTASVLKAKYGLKSLRWSAPELEAQGGEIRQTGLTTADITLPEYVFMTRTGAPQGYRVTAVGTDNEGNLSNTAEMWVNVIPSTETITRLTVTPNRELLANNSDQFTAVALLQSDTGGVLANKAVTFSVSGLKNAEGVTIFDAEGNSGQTLTVITGADGTATVKIISKSAGKGLLKAKMRNGNSRTEAIVFVADSSTAKIKTLELTQNKALANGQEKNIALTTVTDQFDNPVSNFILNARADNGATVVNATAQTDESGRMTTQFSSETAGDSKLVVEGAGTSKSVTAQFIADISTAKIQSAVITHDNATADGKAKNGVLVTVTDSRNNPLASAPVTITVPVPARYQTQPVSGMTDSRGQLQVDITNTKAAQENYTFSINNSTETRQLTFIADETTATITDSQLVIVTNNQRADGVAANQVKATVVDQYNNRVPNTAVEFKTNHDAIPLQAQLTTDRNGEAVFDLTNTKAGETKVTVLVNGKTASVNVTFIADSTTADILDSNMTVPVNNQPADGVTQNTVNVIVTDNKGNRVSFIPVTFSTDPAARPPGGTVVTNEQGEASFNLSSTVATDIMVTAKVNDNTMTKPVTFKAGSAVQSMSLIATDLDTYTAGSDLNVTVTLKDVQGNGISGQSDILTVQAVTVPNAGVKSGSSWVDNSDGTYDRAYIAEKSGAGLKASLKAGNWDRAVQSSAYAITAGSVTQAESSVKTDKVTYTADGDISVTVTLKDAQGNGVTGQQSVLTTEAVTVPNADVKTGSDWKDNSDGTYVRVYTAKTVSTGNTVSLKLSGWGSAAVSGAYAV